MNILKNKKNARIRRSLKNRIRFKNLNIIRLVVHRTPRHIYAQIFDSKKSIVLVSASTVEKKIRKTLNSYTGNKKSASIIGTMIAHRALKKGICSVSFDRSGFKYHGRIQILAESARKAGLKF
ncbi:50S ribosomal protein L18 [Buchnera aphidicola]|uniref:Large ribosomal subunit protein uL18 n=1 Tax=Buchnera aphidicola (Therioaphis trifolii) TaxID=1241884 RepID=A0A4D6YMD7_9GAMM|nr:50S ribosomal protein L18 [Buchnera aphidicola (Therioaphis trifolii)]